jgi:hypothetical protein
MDAGDYRMIVRWVMRLLGDGKTASIPSFHDACQELMDHAWSRLHPKAGPSNETHAKTREES